MCDFDCHFVLYRGKILLGLLNQSKRLYFGAAGWGRGGGRGRIWGGGGGGGGVVGTCWLFNGHGSTKVT